jgi:glycosyltransferase involved in cell wall biosynthesis
MIDVDDQLKSLNPDVGILKNESSVPVSAIIPCYCCCDTIDRALSSISAQTRLPREVILVDDASPDDGKTSNTLRYLAKEYERFFPLRIISLKQNGGPGSARNRGWDAATQPHIAFLDADDAWHPKKLEIQCGWMLAHPEVCLVGHAHVLKQEGDGNWWEVQREIQTSPVGQGRPLFANPFATRTVMLRRDLPFRFKEGKRHSEDYLLWLQIILSGCPSTYIELPLASSYKAAYGEGGLSADLWRMEKGELNTYLEIYREGRIGPLRTCFLLAYSMAKHMRRVLVRQARRLSA